MSEQIQQQMEKMVVEEKSTTDILRQINKSMNDIRNKDYGIKEDITYVVPLKPTKNGVQILELKKDREKEDIHRDLRKIQKLLTKVNDGINKVQMTTYQHLITKRQYRQHETEENIHKKRRREDAHESRKRQASMNTVSSVTCQELLDDMNKTDDDDDDGFGLNLK